MPWPGAGTQSSTGSRTAMRAARSRRTSPATASTRRSKPSDSSLSSRVPTLPRIGAMSRCGQACRSCAARRTLPVPTRGAGSGANSASGSVAACANDRRATTASRGSSRGSTACTCNPGRRSAGRSLALCTARSTCPSTSASSISLTNSRLPPALEIGLRCRRSPLVRMKTNSADGPPARTRAPATASACQRASGLARVPIRSRLTDSSRREAVPRQQRPRGPVARAATGHPRLRPARTAGSAYRHPRRPRSRWAPP